jgi:hypothetical protein
MIQIPGEALDLQAPMGQLPDAGNHGQYAFRRIQNISEEDAYAEGVTDCWPLENLPYLSAWRKGSPQQFCPSMEKHQRKASASMGSKPVGLGAYLQGHKCNVDEFLKSTTALDTVAA